MADLPYADLALVPDRPAQFRGRLLGHAEPTTFIEVTKIGEDRRAIRLFYQPREDCGPVPTGEGLMIRAADGSWKGEVSEYAGVWFVSARAGSARLEFRETDVCKSCGGSGFSGLGTGYSDVCSECGGQSATAEVVA